MIKNVRLHIKYSLINSLIKQTNKNTILYVIKLYIFVNNNYYIIILILKSNKKLLRIPKSTFFFFFISKIYRAILV